MSRSGSHVVNNPVSPNIQLALCITECIAYFVAVLSAFLLLYSWGLVWPFKLPLYHTAQGFLSDVITLPCVQKHRTWPGQGIEPIFMLLPDRWHRIQLPSSLVPPTVICNNVEAEAGLSTTPYPPMVVPQLFDDDPRSLLILLHAA